jgi:hypothetical protein
MAALRFLGRGRLGAAGDSRLKRVKQNCRRCSHGPVGRLPGVKSSAELEPATGRWLQHL